MTAELKHFGVLGMRWGRRRGMINKVSRVERYTGKIKDRKSLRKMSDKELEDLLSSDVMTKKVVQMNKQRSQGRIRSALVLGTIGTILVADHIARFGKPTVHIDYTKWPFKREKAPYYSVKVGKTIARKLLPGG